MLLRPPRATIQKSRFDKGPEERVGDQGFGLELRMELATDEPGMIHYFHHFREAVVRGVSHDPHAIGSQRLLIFPVEFVTVAVALRDLGLTIGLNRPRVGIEDAGLGSQAHGADQIIDASQFPQLVDDTMGCGGIELGTMGLFQAASVAGKFNH